MFNLKNHLQKTANYEGVQGYFVAQTRAWQNCVCQKQKKGASAQDAWQECLGDYQKGDGKIDWVAKYLQDELPKVKKMAQVSGDAQLQMGSYWNKINKRLKKGLSTGQAVLETLDECKEEAGKIPSK